MTILQPFVGLVINGVEQPCTNPYSKLPNRYLNPHEVTVYGRLHGDPEVQRIIGHCGGATTDPRRMPNANLGNCADIRRLLDNAGVVDADLRTIVARLFPEGEAGPSNKGIDQEMYNVLTNTLDAAIDEQDRRHGVPVKPRTPWHPPGEDTASCDTMSTIP